MRLHRFYSTTPIKGSSFDIADRDLIHQWKDVFRYNVGSQVVLFDGFGIDYLCLISSLRTSGATLSVIREMKQEKHDRKRNIWLCVGIIKKDNFETIVEKGTEIGVTHFVPVLCERSEKKSLNMERLKKIAIEASEQSGRSDVPFVHEIIKFEDILDKELLPNNAIFLNSSGKHLSEIEKTLGKDLAVFVGPEGGWGDEEIENFKKHNIPDVSLGNQTLRAETASISVASLLLL